MEKKFGLNDDEYEACYGAATVAAEKLREPLSKAIKEITDEIHESIHNYLMDWLESDLQSNFAGLVRTRAERIINGLFNGSYEEATAKQWLESYDFEKYREKVVVNYPRIITEKRVSELEEENKRLRENLESYRNRY